MLSAQRSLGFQGQLWLDVTAGFTIVKMPFESARFCVSQLSACREVGRSAAFGRRRGFQVSVTVGDRDVLSGAVRAWSR